MSEKRDHTMDHERCCDDVSESKRTPGPCEHTSVATLIKLPSNKERRSVTWGCRDCGIAFVPSNAHDELVEALRERTEAACTPPACGYEPDDEQPESGRVAFTVGHSVACEKSRAALKAAEGE